MSYESDISLLCQNIFRNIGNVSHSISQDIKTLLIKCCGPQKDELYCPFTKILTSEELLIALIKTKKCTEFLSNRPELSVNITDTLFKCYKTPWDEICTLISNVLKSTYPRKEEFLRNVWIRKGIQGFPANLVLLLITEDQALVETLLLEIYKNTREESCDIWIGNNRCFIHWSSQSSQIFTILVSLMNQFLIYAKAKTIVLKIINELIIKIMEECERNEVDFVLLYPLEYQSLVSLLVIEPEINPSQEDVIRRLSELEEKKPNEVLLFLSHFPKWIDFKTETLSFSYL